MDSLASPALSPTEQVKATMGFFRELPVTNNDHQYFFLPVFGFLRPTARQVVEGGGDCADRSRLLITLLHIRGIVASKWALYSKDLAPQHAVVEVVTNRGKMVVDPLFGLLFPSSDGHYHGMKELKSDSRILIERIQQLQSTGVEPGAASIHRYPLDRYVYQYARTINWDKNPIMRGFYDCLTWVFGDEVDKVPRPYVVEQPALMIVGGITIIECCFVVLLLVVRGKFKSKTTSLDSTSRFDEKNRI